MKNKNLLTVLSAVLALCCSVGCQKNSGTVAEDVLSLDPEAKSVISAGGDIKVGITANYAVTAKSNQTWATPVMYDSYCIISVDENFQTSRRTAEVVFTTEKGATASFAITQYSGQEDCLDIYPESLTCKAEGTASVIEIVSNYDVTYTGEYDWVRLEGEFRNFVVTVDAFEGTQPRTATFTFKTAKGLTKDFVVTQTPVDHIKVNVDTAKVDQKENTVAVAVDAYYEVSTDINVGWISCEKVDNNNFNVKIAANTEVLEKRSGRVVFSTAFGAKDTVVVVQDAADVIAASVTEKEVSPDAETFDFTVSSVYAYTMAVDADWLTVTKTAEGKYTVNTPDYRVRAVRTAHITFTSERGNKAVVTVTQAEYYDEVKLSVESSETSYNGARITVKVTSNFPVTATPDVEWISASGSEKTFVVYVQRNNTSDTREGNVKFQSNHGAFATLKVKQNPDTPGAGTRLPDIDIIDISYDE